MNPVTKSSPEIHLPNAPLVEAWLDIRWQLTPMGLPNMLADPTYAFALGVFYDSIKDKFGYKDELPASKAPEGFLPYILQYRFRPDKDGWPLLQLGPGIATVNYSKSYSWKDFKTKALYLREKLLNAYQPDKLHLSGLNLHYRNVYPFEYSSNNFAEFLKDNLNGHITLPAEIPGIHSLKPNPSDTNMTFRYKLTKPEGVGQIQIGTGLVNEMNSQGNVIGKEIILWELDINSLESQVTSIKSDGDFILWLDEAHEIIHEWFFALVKGKMFDEFSKGD
jgi:uncharacterized protein (TIGR04255 family)